jgi:glutamate-1-semialdehyde 2,1-aminomutase
MLTIFFTDRPVTNWATASTCDTQAYAKFFHAMLDDGVYLPPAQFETFFVSLAHTEPEIDRTLEAARRAFRASAR